MSTTPRPAAPQSADKPTAEPTREPTFAEWLAISTALTTYATAIDNQTFDRLAEVFHTDLVADYRAFEVTGLAEMIDRQRRAHVGLRTQHAISNITIAVSLDGQRAYTVCYGNNRIRRPGVPESLYSMGARYQDELALGPEGWRVTKRVARGMWEQGVPPAPDPS